MSGFLSNVFEIMDSLAPYATYGYTVRGVFGLFSFYGIWSFFSQFIPKKIKLSIGEFTVMRKYYDVQNITNIVSAQFYGGGQIPPKVRQEIISKTSPKVKNLIKK